MGTRNCKHQILGLLFSDFFQSSKMRLNTVSIAGAINLQFPRSIVQSHLKQLGNLMMERTVSLDPIPNNRTNSLPSVNVYGVQ